MWSAQKVANCSRIFGNLSSGSSERAVFGKQIIWLKSLGKVTVSRQVIWGSREGPFDKVLNGQRKVQATEERLLPYGVAHWRVGWIIFREFWGFLGRFCSRKKSLWATFFKKIKQLRTWILFESEGMINLYCREIKFRNQNYYFHILRMYYFRIGAELSKIWAGSKYKSLLEMILKYLIAE